MKILVTGATGFVGKALVTSLTAENHQITALVRQHTRVLSSEVEQFVLSDISHLNNASESDPHFTALRDKLESIDVIIHAAARVHVMSESEQTPLTAFRQVNTKATLSLAEMAAAAGVKRFIFLSTIGVNGAQTFNHPFTESDEAAPHNDYATSKWEAEQGLNALADRTGMQVVILRAPLIYGYGAPGNFSRLLNWVEKGLPLPLAKISNRRSLLSLDNLVNFLVTAVSHPRAANQTFLVADEDAVSTSGLIEAIADAAERPARLFYLPPVMIERLFKLMGRNNMYQQLWGNLEIDTKKAQSLLGWKPSTSIKQQLNKN
jgi:nucleoside-diphosphate-sugar epimerase